MATLVTRSILSLCALTALLALAGCGQNGMGGGPIPQMSRILAEPYEWDGQLPETEWEAQVKKLPVLDRPLHVVTSIPEVAVVAKYIGRTHLASLYSVMPPPQAQVITPSAADADPTAEAREIAGTQDTETKLVGRNYRSFDIAGSPADPVAEGAAAPASREAQAIERIKNADIVLLAGSGVDDWMEPLIVAAGAESKTIDLSERMNMLIVQSPVAEEGARNGAAYRSFPNHYWWLNLRPTSLAVDSLDMVFSQMVPKGKADITKWRESWLEQLSQLDGAMAQILLDDPKMDANSVIPRRVLLDSPALAWFAHRFDLTVVDIINTDYDQAPSQERIDEIVRKSKERYVSMIITTSAYHTPAVDQIAKELSIEIFDDQTKMNTTVPVPVVELALGLGEAGQSTNDFIPLHLFIAQKLAKAYKPIIDGLYRMKQNAEKAPDAPAEGEEAPAEGETPAAEGATPPAEGATPPPAEGEAAPTPETTPPAEDATPPAEGGNG